MTTPLKRLNRSTQQHFYSSSVMEYIVPEGMDQAFQQWYGRLSQAAQGYEGFLRADLCTPLNCNDGVVKWYSIVHFTTPDHLNRWLRSQQRRSHFQAGQDIFLAYRFKSFTTGLEGWFSSQAGETEQSGLGPPPWKQVLAVVLGLYPTLVVQDMVFSALGIMQTWPFPSALVINNLITSGILTWLVMPRVTRLLRFWLRPAYRLIPTRVNLLGTVLVLGLLGSLVMVFNLIYS
ncbi:MAG: hypothetical protein EA342_10795 [Leptolyngbya sp. LCM1.Bin17]|nr:MAG: hypothetical protein EA342_10795 [Leptolyngbya sp. LCM1.Bin17]